MIKKPLKANKNKAVAYCRVSTDEQADKGLSLDVQEEVCLRQIAADGYQDFEVIRDEGKSAGSLNRPGIQKVIDLVLNREISAVYAVNSDRIARNTLDHLNLMDLFEKNGVKLRYISQPNSDGSAMAKMVDTVFASFNEMQRRVVSEKVKTTLNAKARAGYFPSFCPLGYKNAQNPDLAASRLANRIIIPDPIMGPLITEAFKLYATGDYNGYDLNDLMYEKGLRTKTGGKLSPSRFYEIFKNPVYVGEVHWGDVHITEGKHKPLIDRETFERASKIMAGNNHHACRRRKYQWLLNGFVYCAKHQRRYTAEWHLNKGLAYYHCPNRTGCGRYIEMNELENKVAEKFKELELDPKFIELVIEKVKDIFYSRRRDYESKRQALINQRTAFEAKKKIAEDKLLSGILSDDDFSKIRQELNLNITNLNERTADLDNRQEIKVDIAQEVLRFASDIYSAYIKAPLPVKRHYLALFWERFEIADGVIIKSVPSLLFGELMALNYAYQKSSKAKFNSVLNSLDEVILSKQMLAS